MAAARMLQLRRALSILSRNQPRSSISADVRVRSVPLKNSFLSSGDDFSHRWFLCHMRSTFPVKDEEENVATTRHSTAPAPTDASNMANSAASRLKVSAGHDLAIAFTCKVCETRSVKTTCRKSYEKGVVVVRCSGCDNLHLIADRLGWFGEPGSIEDILAACGEDVKKGSADTLNLTLEDLAGSGEGLKDT